MSVPHEVPPTPPDPSEGELPVPPFSFESDDFEQAFRPRAEIMPIAIGNRWFIASGTLEGREFGT